MRYAPIALWLVASASMQLGCSQDDLPASRRRSSHAALDVTSGGASSFVASSDAFERERETRFALGLPYRELRKSLKHALDSYEATYLENPKNPAGDFGPAGEYAGGRPKLDCATGEPMRAWKNKYVFHMLGPLAEVFYSCQTVFDGDPVEPDLAGRCRAAVVRIADHVLANANATEFHGYVYRNPFQGGREEKPLGWTNTASSWDAWGNGSCSSPASPSSWASAHAMSVMAMAHSLTGDVRYRQALHKAMSYYHQTKRVDLRSFGRGNREAKRIADALDAKRAKGVIGEYAVTPLYTIGASRFRLPRPGPSGVAETMFYHYKGEDDPARNTLNTNATMAQALLYAAEVDPETRFAIAKPAGGEASLSYRDLAVRTIYPIYRNVALGNMSYHDVDDIAYSPRRGYEAHVLGTLGHLVRVGALLRNDLMLEAARKMAAAVEALHHPATAGGLRGTCAARALSAKLLAACREGLATVPAVSHGSLWSLWDALQQADYWATR